MPADPAYRGKFMAKKYSSPPTMAVDSSKKYHATLKTDRGDIRVELFAKDAPKTVNNFVFLAKDGFYDGVVFHRVIPGFMAQGGDPTGSGSGGPGYSFADEPNPQTHQTGSLSMANAGPNTNGSQFFICYEPQPHLNGKHTVFGRVVEGMDVVKGFPERDPMRGGPPAATITSVDVEETPA
jgi:peptidyl-prolyl cis-trans isomerase B (cyclophilin B)